MTEEQARLFEHVIPIVYERRIRRGKITEVYTIEDDEDGTYYAHVDEVGVGKHLLISTRWLFVAKLFVKIDIFLHSLSD